MIRHVVLGCVLLAAGAGAPADEPRALPYKVDGNKVDAGTLAGWKTWRALACDRCHGKNQEGEGTAGPSLNEGMKSMTKEEFKEVVLKGRIASGMPNFDGSKLVTDTIENLYSYLKGRSDGAIPGGRLEPLQ
jgi:mono/diheme cytochrome c family protein